MLGIVGRAFDSFYQIFRGLCTVSKHTFRPPTTGEYPEIDPSLPGTFRGRLALAVNPLTGEHRCISCLQCERVCPDKCIKITSHKSPETNKLELIDFVIDEGLCMFCGLCTEVCPTRCIIHTNYFEFSEYGRSALLYDLKALTLSQEESAHYFAKKSLPLPKPKPPKPAQPAKPLEKTGPAAASKESGQEESKSD
jgi:NADH-quinone oxidoreductase subunit I